MATGMNEARAIYQRILDKQQQAERERQQSAFLAERERQLAKATTLKQTVFSQEIKDQLLSDNGYKKYRIKLDDMENEWIVEQHTLAWNWECIDTIGFHRFGKVKMYKTLVGALKRVKKEMGVL